MLIENIDRRLEEIYEEFKRDKSDKTGWCFLRKLKKESNFHSFLFSFFFYRSFEIAYKKGEIINAIKPIEKLIECSWHKEKDSLIPKERGSGEKGEKEIFPGVIFKKGILTKVLEKLDLQSTLAIFYNVLIVNEKEINPEKYLSENQIRKFNEGGKKLVLEKFLEEYNQKKLKEKPRIVEMKDD